MPTDVPLPPRAAEPAGVVGPPGDERVVMAAQALATVRADAVARGARPAAAADGKFSKPGKSTRPGIAGEPSGRQRRDDPAPLEAAIGGLITEAGWEQGVVAGSLLGRWAQIVGPDLAAHTTPDGLTDGVLAVTASSTAWATQVSLLASELVRRLNAELGDGTVRRVNVRGPGGPAGRRGEWRVRGGRGPRDTYG